MTDVKARSAGTGLCRWIATSRNYCKMPQTLQHLGLPLPETLNPDAIDVLSELANLLQRLRTLPTSTTNATTTPSHLPATQTTPAPTPLISTTPASQKKTPGGGPVNGELTLKEFPAATNALRHQFQHTRNLVKTSLPDLDRTIADQEVEIAALEARIARQRDTLAQLRVVGARLGLAQEDGDGDGDPMDM
ncbi:RNA polymerase II transcription mediator complex subunit 9-domain-containing protein [Xylaria nigripes]|nr:RNA polymerase II transcription mediator complex subunit 9-domain-containing protein [Xylaria nigripes]